MQKLKITLKKSLIGRLDNHKKVLQALGLKKIGQSVVKEDNASIRGMIHKVDFMVQVEEVNEEGSR